MAKDFCAHLTVVVHSHRHNNSLMMEISGEGGEEDQSLSQDVDISVIRDVMYKYSQKAQKKFFQVPELSFLFIWFASNPTALLKTKAKIETKGPEYCKRILKDIEDMKNDAIVSL